MWFFVTVVLLFRPFQVIWLKRKLVLATFLLYGLDTLYRVVLRALRINQSKSFTKQKIPFHLMFLMSISVQVYFLMKHFLSGRSRKQRATFFFQMILPTCFSDILPFVPAFSLYPAYIELNKEGKLLIAISALLVGVVLKVISRISGCGNLYIRDIRMCYWCRCILAQLFCFEYCKPTKTVYNPWLLLE